VSKSRLMEQLGLEGLIHIWGRAGTGKTLLACLIAADESRLTKIEWINTDAKQSFVSQLRQTIESEGGLIQNITVTMARDRKEVRDLILSLTKDIESDCSLVVIDSITRLLDMARENPTLWGREMIEEALPTLAGIVNKHGVNVIVTSESRAINESDTLAVHHKTIAKWADHDVRLIKNGIGDSSLILEGENQIGILRFSDNGVSVVSRLAQRLGQMEV
jgi:RecA/RadA recombinase